jgi:hypothetical protein
MNSSEAQARKHKDVPMHRLIARFGGEKTGKEGAGGLAALIAKRCGIDAG